MANLTCPTLLARVQPALRNVHSSQHNHTSDREAKPFLLGTCLRMCLLILRGVGHAYGRVVDLIDMTTVPQQLFIKHVFAACAYVDGYLELFSYRTRH